jgi:hypothetical protein
MDGDENPRFSGAVSCEMSPDSEVRIHAFAKSGGNGAPGRSRTCDARIDHPIDATAPAIGRIWGRPGRRGQPHSRTRAPTLSGGMLPLKAVALHASSATVISPAGSALPRGDGLSRGRPDLQADRDADTEHGSERPHGHRFGLQHDEALATMARLQESNGPYRCGKLPSARNACWSTVDQFGEQLAKGGTFGGCERVRVSCAATWLD